MPLYIAYALVIVFFGVERLLRRGAVARALTRGADDRGSTRLIGLAFAGGVGALLVAPLLNWVGGGPRLPAVISWLGVGLMVAGLVMRAWATLVLGEFYTRALGVETNQRIIQQGPYRLVRHPGYLGTLLLWVGGGLATGNTVALGIIVMLFALAYAYRIHSEEAMLSQTFGELYLAYARHTWRLIPFVL